MKYALRVLAGVNHLPHYESVRSSRKKVVEGVFCRSERVRATKRQRRIFSLGRCHVSDRWERNLEARSSH